MPVILKPGARIFTIQLVVNNDRKINSTVETIARELDLKIGNQPYTPHESIIPLADVPVRKAEFE